MKQHLKQKESPVNQAKASSDVREFITFKLVTLSRLVERHSARYTNPPANLGMPEVRLLSLIYSLGECSLKDLTLVSRWDAGNTSKSTDKLVRLGYATRKPDPSDRRVRIIKLTEKGVISAEAYLAARNKVNHSLLARFSKKEVIDLEQTLTKLESFFLSELEL